MSVILTNGQSFEQIAADFTLSPEYAPAIAIQNNYEGQSITGKRFRIEIPDNWMKPEYAGKTITLPGFSTGIPVNQTTGGSQIITGVPNWVVYGVGGLLAVFLLMPKRKRR